MFETEGIDHVAMLVRDVGASAAWYERVLGLRRLHEAVWGDFPAVVGTRGTSLALFAVASENPKPRPDRETIAMRHIAFRVSAGNLEQAMRHLTELGIPFTEQDHTIARSIYFYDPDGHEIELTTYEREPTRPT